MADARPRSAAPPLRGPIPGYTPCAKIGRAADLRSAEGAGRPARSHRLIRPRPKSHISTKDYFHPSVAGQTVIADQTWNYSQYKP